MIKKYCNKCGQFSYSSVRDGQWICPVCGQDLKRKLAMQLDDVDVLPRDERAKVIPFKQRRR